MASSKAVVRERASLKSDFFRQIASDHRPMVADNLPQKNGKAPSWNGKVPQKTGKSRRTNRGIDRKAFQNRYSQRFTPVECWLCALGRFYRKQTYRTLHWQDAVRLLDSCRPFPLVTQRERNAAAGFVYLNDLHLYLLVEAHHFVGVFHAVVGHAADVDQALDLDAHIYEATEVGNV